MHTKAYSCINIDEKIRKESSSGGVYTLLAEKIISIGGVVFAAVYEEHLQVKHVRIDSFDGIKASRGAKYVFSEYADSLGEVYSSLKNGQIVMFVGTPCQCAAVLAKASEYRENLLCVDLVCHGAPAKKYWNEYLRSLSKRNGNLLDVNMRCKNTGWSRYKYCWEQTFNGGKKIIELQEKNSYMIGFTKNYYLRQSCYTCKHKGYERLTDITLGDFWGVWDILPEMDDNRGTSLILIHSDKGMSYLNQIKGNLKVVEITKDMAVKYNKSILEPSVKNKNADLFQKELDLGKDFIDLINKFEKVSFIKKIKYKIKYIVGL